MLSKKSHDATPFGALLDRLMETPIQGEISHLNPTSEEFRLACVMTGNAPELAIRHRTDQDENWATKKTNSIERFEHYQRRLLANIIVIRSILPPL